MVLTDIQFRQAVERRPRPELCFCGQPIVGKLEMCQFHTTVCMELAEDIGRGSWAEDSSCC